MTLVHQQTALPTITLEMTGTGFTDDAQLRWSTIDTVGISIALTGNLTGRGPGACKLPVTTTSAPGRKRLSFLLAVVKAKSVNEKMR